jgi:diketogulonate reductase-like aldo/keto reductase
MFTLSHILLIEIFSEQIEFHPYWHEDELLEFCKKHNITFDRFSPGGAPDRAV